MSEYVTAAPSGSGALTVTTAVLFSGIDCVLLVAKTGASLTSVTVTDSDCTTGLVPSVAVTCTR